jgi:parallel beta-helix repeat protein
MLTRKLIITLVAAVAISASSTVWATTYYVDPCGDDSNGLSWPTAFHTIQQGIDASNSTRVEVNEANYVGSIDFNGVATTVTSTNPNSPSVVAATVINGNNATQAVYFQNSETATSVLTGFYITGASYGVHCSSASPTITNCDVNDVSTHAYYLSSSSAKITDCIGRNTRNVGGGVCAVQGSPEVIGCTFTDNTGDGALYSSAGGKIEGCVIEDNGDDGIDAVGLYTLTIMYNYIGDNSDYGICLSNSKASIKNNWIYDNANAGIYAGISNQAAISNNTLEGNVKYGIYATGTAPTITNTIIWDCNDDMNGCTATYSCIKDCNDASGTGNICGDGNDPNFDDAANDDYHIADDSPCIDVGDPGGSYGGQTDIDGEDRVMDGDGNCNEIVDMGADEAWGPDCWNCDSQCYGDADCSGIVNLADLYILREAYDTSYGDPNYNACADFDKDGDVDDDDKDTLDDWFGDPDVPTDCSCGGTWPP